MEYVKDSAVTDDSPPPTPTNLRIRRGSQAVLTWTATAATMTTAGATGLNFRNVIFDFTGIDVVVTALLPTAQHIKFYSCRFVNGTSTAQATRSIVASTANGLGFYDCDFYNSGDAGPASFVKIVGDALDPDGFEFVRCKFNGVNSVTALEFITTGPKNLLIQDCSFREVGAVANVVTWIGTETGWLIRNKCKLVAGQGIQPFSATPALMSLHDNTCSDGSGENGAAVVGAGAST
mgnify:CR=1 FL=1